MTTRDRKQDKCSTYIEEGNEVYPQYFTADVREFYPLYCIFLLIITFYV